MYAAVDSREVMHGIEMESCDFSLHTDLCTPMSVSFLFSLDRNAAGV